MLCWDLFSVTLPCSAPLHIAADQELSSHGKSHSFSLLTAE